MNIQSDNWDFLESKQVENENERKRFFIGSELRCLAHSVPRPRASRFLNSPVTGGSSFMFFFIY